MKKFLQKYGVSEEVLTALLEAYKKEHPEATELPEYIGKSRFDEVNKKLKDSEKKVADLEKQVGDLTSSSQSAIEAAVKKATDELTATHKAEVDKLTKDHSIEVAIMAAKGRNVKAIKALIDPEKKVEDEIARLQKDEAYLFGAEDDIPGGTGKNGNSGTTSSDKELNAMRDAVGVTY
jgi:DNA-binding transcriptional MerR regulator